LRGRQGY